MTACIRAGQLFVVSAPSGAGKSTILHRLIQDLPGIGFSISHTTRQPRSGEQHGREYFFVSREEFETIRDRGAGFLEWAEVHGNLYGTSHESVATLLQTGEDLLLDIDVQGASQLRRQTSLPVSYIFIAPPSLDELRRRLAGRGSDPVDIVEMRLANAQKELACMDAYEYVVVNDDLEQAVAMCRGIILACRSRNRRLFSGKPFCFEGGSA